MQHAIGGSGNLYLLSRRIAKSARDGQSAAKRREQPKGIQLCQAARGLIPTRAELLGTVRGSQIGLQLGEGFVVETKISGGEAFLQNRHAGEERHRRALHLIRRSQQQFSIALKKRASHSSRDVGRKRDFSIFQGDVQIWPVERCSANVESSRRI